MNGSIVNEVIMYLPGILGCLYLFLAYRTECKVQKKRMEIATRMNWHHVYAK